MITVSCLGHLGHLGNQLFQYAFARAYAEKMGTQLLIPNWVGREVFEGINEPVIGGDSKHSKEKTENPKGENDIDLFGYFQRPEHLALLSRKKLKQWFKPKPKYSGKIGHDLVFHKRRGDYISHGNFAVVSDKSYLDAAIKFGYGVEVIKKTFSDEKGLCNADQYDDFFEIIASRAIFRANSTYSWWAATLSEAKIYSPVVENKTGWGDFNFVEGNHSKMVHMFGEMNLPE